MPYPSPPPYWNPETMLPGYQPPPDGPPSQYPPYPGTPPPDETPTPPPPLVPPIISDPAIPPDTWDQYPIAILNQAGPLLFTILDPTAPRSNQKYLSSYCPDIIQWDDFTGDVIKPFWIRTTNGGDFSVAASILTITAGAGLLPTENWLYQFPLCGNFDIKTFILTARGIADTNYQAGILVKLDDNNYAAGFTTGGVPCDIYARTVVDGTTSQIGPFAGVLPGYGRIRRVDGVFQLLYSINDVQWVDVTPPGGPHKITSPMKAGLFCNQVGLPGETATFDWIKNA